MKGKKIVISGDDAGIERALETIRTADKAAEKTWKGGCGILAVSVVGGFLTAITSSPGSPLVPLALAFFAIVFIVGAVQIYRGQSGDIEDERYELVQTVHRFLSLDCDKDAQFEYHLDLRSYYDSSFFLRKEKFGTVLPRGSISYYQMPLLTSRLKLRDGTAVSIQVDRLTARKTVTKFGRSGKIKTKTKNKFRDIHQVKVKLPDGAPPLPALLPTMGFPREPEYKAEGTKASASLVHKGSPNGGPDPTYLLRLLCLLFFAVHQERQSAA